MNTTNNNNKGFTIIEVVLVLAIAALIFLMIFVALPALQASQRDTARKNDASIVAAAVTKYTSAFKQLPNGSTNAQNGLRVFQQYVPDLDQYDKNRVTVWVNRNDPPRDRIVVYTNAKCNGPAVVAAPGGKRSAVRILLEDSTIYCVDAS